MVARASVGAVPVLAFDGSGGYPGRIKRYLAPLFGQIRRRVPWQRIADRHAEPTYPVQTLIDAVAQMTRSRQRDVLEASVVGMLADAIYPDTLRLFRLVPVGNRMVVHCRAEALGREPVRLNPLPPRAGALPPVELFPWVADWLRGAAAEPIEYARPAGCCYLFPISDGLQACGWVEMEHPRTLGDAERQLVAGLLAIFANHLSVIEYGERDALTGLANRKTFEDAFQQALRALPDRAGGSPEAPDTGCWLGIVDVDHFKQVNDRLGHLYGDEVLVLLARHMRDSFRLSDRLFRLGGEEFAVLLERTEARHAGPVFDRFRARVAAHRFPQIGRVTVSIGYTRIDAGDVCTRAFDRADAALYHAKHQGRNRICSWDTLAQAGVLSHRAENGEVELF